MKNIQIYISGTVYQVGFRYFVKQIANNYHIEGRVRYTGDRSIYIEAQGKPEDLYVFLNYCKLGCLESNVKDISITESQLQEYQSFEIQ